MSDVTEQVNKFLGKNNDDVVYVGVDNDLCTGELNEVTLVISCSEDAASDDVSACAYLTPQTARELAAHLIALADKLEGKAE